MVEISDRRIGTLRQFAPLPPLMTPEEILGDALPVLDPPSRMTVTDAAERYIRIQAQGAWQQYDREVTPYMVEPADMTQSRRFKAVAFEGPSQSGKTMMLQSVSMHAVTVDQAPTLIVHMSKPERDKWVEEKLDPLIRNSPEILDRLGRAREDDTFSRKRFKGMRLLIGYPTPQMLSGGTYKLVLLTDIDHHPLVLGGKDNPEGSPFRMAMQRIKTYLSRGCVLVEGSPAWPVSDPDWTPTPGAPHELPPVKGGIAAIYNQGTRARLYWECPDCGELFEPRFDRLHYDAALDPGAAGDAAEMECPHCGSLIAPRHKAELNRGILKGRGGWLHEGQEGELVSIDDSDIRRTEIASYQLNGAAASFQSWRDLVADYERARRQVEELDDETDLATVYYTGIGLPYRPLKLGKGDDVGLQFLRDNAQATPRGVLPSWTRFVTVTVDVQDYRFPVQVTAWGPGNMAQIVDRYDIVAPPEGAPSTDAERSVQPPKYAEDWRALEELGEKVWPVEGANYGLRALGLVVDFQGSPGVSDNAEKFWRDRSAAGQGKRWFISRGHGGWKVPRRVWHEAPERGSKGKKARAIKLLNIATDRLKDTIAAMISRADGDAAGALYTGAWMTDDQLEELIAEERLSAGWAKRKGKTRNETLDLSHMARAVAEQLKMLTIKDWEHPPLWAAAGPENTMAVENGATPEPAPASGRKARRIPRRLF